MKPCSCLLDFWHVRIDAHDMLVKVPGKLVDLSWGRQDYFCVYVLELLLG
ncbi:hypothetical protein [Verrucomicrobium spinosum]|nr:hypothetical protein [Verrucomicrobium spinosum]